MTGMWRQVRVVLEPLGDLEPRDFGQLNIHQDQVGPVLARESDRLHAALGLHGLVAMRFEKIVEELHVQLIILDDQNLFLHLIPPRPPRPARKGRTDQNYAT